MTGSELAPYPDYLLGRAREELSVGGTLGPSQLRAASAFVRVFGVPEIGVQLRVGHVLRRLPRDVGAFADLGCGAGMLLGAISRRKRFRSLTGFEIDAPSARIAARLHPRARIIESPVERAHPEFDGSFDTAACVEVLEHLDEATLHAFLARAFALLRPGGSFVVHVPRNNQHRHFARFRDWGHADHEREGFAPQELATLLSEAGFAIEALEATTGRVASFAWEVNMMAAARPWQAIAFPVGLASVTIAERLRFSEGNGVLCTAMKPG